MTGFGKASFMVDGTAYAVEIRSLNSKQLDLNVRIPAFLKEKEMEIRKTVGKGIKRGKVDINIFAEKKEESNSYTINQSVIKEYLKEIKDLQKDISIAKEIDLDTLLKLPNALQVIDNNINDNS